MPAEPAQEEDLDDSLEVRPATVKAVKLDAPKPAWIEQPTRLDHGVYRTVVHSGLYVTPGECQRALDDAVLRAVHEYAEQYLGMEEAAVTPIEPAFIKRHIQKDVHSEFVEVSVGQMQQLHSLLEFDDAVRETFRRLYRTAMVRLRLLYAASGFLAAILLLGIVFGYLKLVQRARDSQRQRLQIAAATVILIVVAGAAWIPTQLLNLR